MAQNQTSDPMACSLCDTKILQGLAIHHKEKPVCSSCLSINQLFFRDEEDSKRYKKMCLFNKRVNNENYGSVKYKCLFCDNINKTFGLRMEKLESNSVIKPDGFTFTLNLSEPNICGYFIGTSDTIFLLSAKIRPEENNIYWHVRSLNDSEYRYGFEISVKKNDFKCSLPGTVSHIADDKKLVVVMHTKIYECEGATFSITISRGEQKNFKLLQSNNIKEICSGTRSCKNFSRGCDFEDTSDKKLAKHELLYCPFAANCQFCLTDMSLTGNIIFSHYSAHHKDITYPSGEAWPSSTDPYLGGLSGKCLLSSPVGILVCSYREYEDRLNFAVHAPISRANIDNYHCEVSINIMHPVYALKYEAKLQMVEEYDEIYDWYTRIPTEMISVFWKDSPYVEFTVNLIKRETPLVRSESTSGFSDDFVETMEIIKMQKFNDRLNELF